MTQLRLFGPPPIDLLAKMISEQKAGIKVNYYWDPKK